MRLIHSALVGALALAGVAATAAAQQPASDIPQATAHGARGAHGGHGARGERGARGGADRAMLKGIQLTADEQTRLESVHQKYASQLAAERKADAPRMKAMRDARQRGDTAALRSLRASMAQKRGQGSAVREAMLRDVRAALTPAHQAQFDANVASAKARFARKDHGARPRAGSPGGATVA